MLNNYEIKMRGRSRVTQGRFKTTFKLTLVLVIWYVLSLIYADYSGSRDDGIVAMALNLNIGQLVGTFVGTFTESMVQEILIGVFTLGSTWALVEWRRTDKEPEATLEANFRFWKKDTIVDTVVLLGIRFLFHFLWSFLLFIPGYIKSLAYSQATFIYAEDVKAGRLITSLTDYITRSRQLMNGHKMQLFTLQLSFIGWWILVLITSGLAGIFVIPYYTATMAEFYLELQHEYENGEQQHHSKPTYDDINDEL